MILLSDGTEHRIGEPFEPTIETIAQSLAYTNRYNGALGGYSVAQHSILVSRMLCGRSKLDGLLHDAHETYVGDVLAPLKKYLPDYTRLEVFYQDRVDLHFDVDTRSNAVKAADKDAYVIECVVLGLDVPEIRGLNNIQRRDLSLRFDDLMGQADPRWDAPYALSRFKLEYALCRTL